MTALLPHLAVLHYCGHGRLMLAKQLKPAVACPPDVVVVQQSFASYALVTRTTDKG